MTPSLQFRGAEKNIPPIQIAFLLKERNQKKLNSHRWALNAISPILEPNICVLLDVGTRPGPDSIYKLWKAFDMDSRVAGAAGEIRISAGKTCSGCTLAPSAAHMHRKGLVSLAKSSRGVAEF